VPRGPGDQLVELGEEVLQQAREDVLFGREVVVDGRLRDPEPLGDLAQRRARVAALGEHLQGHDPDLLPGVGSPLVHATTLLDARLGAYCI